MWFLARNCTIKFSKILKQQQIKQLKQQIKDFDTKLMPQKIKNHPYTDGF
jgi:hypothetical protein